MHSPAPKRRKPEEEVSSYFHNIPKEIILHIFHYLQDLEDYTALRCTCSWMSRIIDSEFIKLHIRVAANATESSALTSKRIEESVHKILNKNAILALDIFTEPLFNSSITDLSAFQAIPATLRHLSLTTGLCFKRKFFNYFCSRLKIGRLRCTSA